MSEWEDAWMRKLADAEKGICVEIFECYDKQN